MKGAIMSEETTDVSGVIEETIALVKESHTKGIFNLSEVIKGRGYPTKDVTIYLDADAAFRLAEINEALNEYVPDDIRETLEAEGEALAETIKKSALTFTMRGVSQKIVEEVTAKTNTIHPTTEFIDPTDNQEWVKYYIAALIATNILRVTTADGAVDERVFTAEEMLELRDGITKDAWNVLVEGMQKLTLASGYFDQLTDAGFLPKS